MALYSVQVERHALSGLIQNQEVFSEIERFVSDKDFVAEPHNIIFSCLKSSYLNNEKIDKVLLAQKIKCLGISFKENIDIFDYIEAISLVSITPEATIKACKELVKLRCLREISITADKIKETIAKSASENLTDTINTVDSLYGKQMNSFEVESEPQDLFSDIIDAVEERGNNPIEDIGLSTPFPEFNRMYGGLRGGNFYAFASRPKNGKALEENELIPTPNGFTKIKDLKIGDEVFSINGRPTKVVAIKVWENRPIYKITSNDGSFVLADENHEWLGKRICDCRWEILTSIEICKRVRKEHTVFKLPKSCCLKLENKKLTRTNLKNNHIVISEFFGYANTVCIEIEDNSHIFLCGKGMMPTHNSTLLDHLAVESGKINNCPVLILDTEMQSEEIKFRMAANKTGVPLWFLETGQWRKNEEMIEKVRRILSNLKKDKNRTFHYYVGNRPVDEVCSIIRRWILKFVGRGNKCIIVYDYLKLTGEKLGQNWAEHQALGEKVNKFKEISVEFNFPFLTAIQLNRTGENLGKQSSEISDDSSSVAQSDRVMWFCTYLGIFRRKTPDEIALDTEESGSHKLIEIAARYQGRDAAGHQDFLLRKFPDGKQRFVRNYINYNIQDFRIEERGSLKDSIYRQNAKYLVQDSKTHQQIGDTL